MTGFFTSPGFRGAVHTTLFASLLHPIVVTVLRGQKDGSDGFSWSTVSEIARSQTPTYAVVLFVIMAGWAGYKYRKAQQGKNTPETR